MDYVQISKEIGEDSFSGSEYFDPLVLDEKAYWEKVFRQTISNLCWEIAAEIAAGDNGFALTSNQYREIQRDCAARAFPQDGTLGNVLHWILMDKVMYFEPVNFPENGNKDFYRVYLKEDLNLLRKNPVIFDELIDRYSETMKSRIFGYR